MTRATGFECREEMFRAHISCQWLSLGCQHKQVYKGNPPHQGMAVLVETRITAAVEGHGQTMCRNQDELESCPQYACNRCICCKDNTVRRNSVCIGQTHVACMISQTPAHSSSVACYPAGSLLQPTQDISGGCLLACHDDVSYETLILTPIQADLA